MKSIKSISMLLFCGALLMTSCLPSENEINPLTGTWTLKGVSCQNCIDISQITSTTFSCNDSQCNTYTFTEEGTLTLLETSSGATKFTTGTYAISCQTVTLHFNDEESTVKKFTYTISGSMLYLKELVDKGTGKCGATTVLAK